MIRTLTAALILLGTAARAAQRTVVIRREVIVKAPVYGIVVAHDLFRLKAPFDGRIQQVLVGTGTWADASHPLATMVNSEYAAMIDAKGRVDEDTLATHWQGVFSPSKIRCKYDCFVLKSYVRPSNWVKSQAFIAEAAQGLRLVARAQLSDAYLIHRGLTMNFWSLADPKRRYSLVLPGVLSDLADQPSGDGAPAAPSNGQPRIPRASEPNAGVTFEVELSPRLFMQPGTEWQGEVIISDHPNALSVPTSAVIRSGTSAYIYMPVPVSVGLPADGGVTEILNGAAEGQSLLIVDEPVTEAPRQPRTDLRPTPRPTAPVSASPPIPEAAPPPRQPINDQDLGDDPYGGR